MSRLTAATKDELVLAMLAVLGGEHGDINERDLFLASWHAFPNAMRWVDTPLPNPDTFTASLRRLDQRGLISRGGKQQRRRGRRGAPSRRTADDAGRSVVKARIVAKAPLDAELVEEVRRLVPKPELTRALSDASLVAFCVGLRVDEHLHVDEGALVELAFHKFSSRFAYRLRPELPDLETIRNAIRAAQDEHLLDASLNLTDTGQTLVAELRARLDIRLDASQSHEAGDLVSAGRIEKLEGFQAYRENGTLVRAKADELFRALRVPPTTDPTPVAEALASRVRALRRIDRGAAANYLIEVARIHNPDVLARAEATHPEILETTTAGKDR